jgi:RHS repeat-associated protein
MQNFAPAVTAPNDNTSSYSDTDSDRLESVTDAMDRATSYNYMGNGKLETVNDVDRLNLYAYVGNNPVSWVDPDGEEAALATLALLGLKCQECRSGNPTSVEVKWLLHT